MTTKSSPRQTTQSETAASDVIAESKIRYLPLGQFSPPTNARKTPATAAEDAELEASIRVHGIKQNLIVHRAEIDGQTVQLVDAGGRRLKIVQKLAREGIIDAETYKVPCIAVAAAHALEISLIENTIRANMHPADEFVAMAALIDAGMSIKDVVRRFGCTERHVRQRLRLGKVAPELLDAYRAGDIDLECVTAFTLGTDHAAQLAVLNQLKAQNYLSHHSVRRLITQGAVPLDSKLGIFVGRKAYKAAGGTITEDLFSSDKDAYMEDAALVRRLAQEKLDAKAEELRSEWAWTKALLDPEFGFIRQYHKIEPKPGKLPSDLAEELDRIEQRLAELGVQKIPEDDFTAELALEFEQLEERHDEITEIAERLASFSKKDRKRAGCVVTVSHDGEFLIHQGLVDRATMGHSKNIEAGEPLDDDNSDDEFDTEFPSGDDGEESSPSADAEVKLRKELGLSQRLIDDLKAHRLQITRAYLGENFEVAFDLALYSLALDVLNEFSHRGDRGLDLRAIETRPEQPQ